MVKMPLAFLSLEKLHKLKVDRNAVIYFDSSRPWHHPLLEDSTARSKKPSIAHLIKRALLISENDPYNRMYQFMGQGAANRLLHEKGYTTARITRQFLGLTEAQNRETNPVRVVDRKGKVIYSQPSLINTDSFDFSEEHKIGKGYIDKNDSLVQQPFDFTKHNFISLGDMQQMLQSVLFPESVPPNQRFDISEDDRKFLFRYLSQFPGETPDPKYDTASFYDSYVKFFFYNASRRLPEGVRVFNKVGWSYGFLTDVSYVADFRNKVEFMLAATLYVNEDGVINDDKYEYDSIGLPFLYQLGQTVYQYELSRKRQYLPDLRRFAVRYEKRDPADERKAMKKVDN